MTKVYIYQNRRAPDSKFGVVGGNTLSANKKIVMKKFKLVDMNDLNRRYKFLISYILVK